MYDYLDPQWMKILRERRKRYVRSKSNKATMKRIGGVNFTNEHHPGIVFNFSMNSAAFITHGLAFRMVLN